MAVLLTFLFTVLGVVLGGLITWCVGRRLQPELVGRLREMVLDRRHVCLNEEFVLARLLVEEIRKAGFAPDVIYAISPGGGMISEWLSRVGLGDYSNPVPVRSICVHAERSGGGVETEKAVVKEDLKSVTSGFRPQSTVLLVNDISRGGATLQVAYDFLSQFFLPDGIATATLFCHTDARTKPRFYAAMTDKTIWFDWKHSPMP
jgi:hypoxanthine phosphoribosyltransferase